MTSRPRTPYAYILAASHSGSTLLAMLLNAHADVTTVGELTSGASRNMDGYRCSCRKLMTECQFWQGISADVRERHPSFNLSDFGIRWGTGSPWWIARLLRIEHRGRLLEGCRDSALALSPAWRTQLSGSTAVCEDLARAVLRRTGARMVIDSSKLAHRLKFVRRFEGLDVKVVHLVRDGRAVALTYIDTDTYADSREPAFRRGGRGPEGPAQQPRLSMDEAAMEWRRSVRSAEHVLSRMRRDQWIAVRYEDLCSRPDETLARIMAFLDLDPGRLHKAFRSVDHHVVGNGMRMDQSSEVALDDRWKSVLTDADRTTFDRVAGALNRRYYPDVEERPGSGTVARAVAVTAGSWDRPSRAR